MRLCWHYAERASHQKPTCYLDFANRYGIRVAESGLLACLRCERQWLDRFEACFGSLLAFLVGYLVLSDEEFINA